MTRTLLAPVHVRFLRIIHVCGNPSQAIISVGRTLLLSRKRAPDTTLSLAEWSAGPSPNFSPTTAIEAVMKVKHLLTIAYINLLGTYYQYAIDMFNTCWGRATHRSLTDIVEGYNLAGAGLPTPLPDLPNRWSYTFHLIAVPGLRLSIQTLPTGIKREQTLDLMSGTSLFDFYRSLLSKHSMS
jgi:hypothetical protein